MANSAADRVLGWGRRMIGKSRSSSIESFGSRIGSDGTIDECVGGYSREDDDTIHHRRRKGRTETD